MRKVLYVNITRFPIAVERVLSPSLRSRPLVIAPPQSGRAPVWESSEEARAAGILPGMPMAHAKKVCKDLVVLPPRPELYSRVAKDLEEKVVINSKKDLLVYSYRVAGTVGLMMSKIMKVKNKEALKGAIDLGIAMQLTNIARDVCEDKARNRQYIEHDFSSIQAIINESQVFYEKSFTSISSIPVKSRFSVIVARRVYRKIGDYILKQKNIDNYNKAGKIYVPVFEKIIQTFLSFFDFIKLLFIQNLNYVSQEKNASTNRDQTSNLQIV